MTLRRKGLSSETKREMRNLEKTSEEKTADHAARSGIMLLGKNPAQRPQKHPYPFFLFWGTIEGIEQRKGQRCKVLKSNIKVADIEFEDGFRFRVKRRAIRRAEG